MPPFKRKFIPSDFNQDSQDSDSDKKPADSKVSPKSHVFLK